VPTGEFGRKEINERSVRRGHGDELGGLFTGDLLFQSYLNASLAFSIGDDVDYEQLYSEITNQLIARLHANGIGEADAARIARTFVDALPPTVSKAFNLADPAQSAAVVEVALAGIRISREATLDFQQVTSADSLPPPLRKWQDRDPAKFPTAEDFLKEAYKGRLGIDGDLTLADLGRLDPPLLNALNLEFRGKDRRVELHKLLPTLKERNDAKLERELGYVPQGKERQSALAVMARGERPRTRRPKPR
jgi:hypothetical protein